MTDTPTAIEVNCETGEVTTRPLTAEEIAQRAAEAETAAQQKAEADAAAAYTAELKASAKAKLVAGTPLTEEEAATLVI